MPTLAGNALITSVEAAVSSNTPPPNFPGPGQGQPMPQPMPSNAPQAPPPEEPKKGDRHVPTRRAARVWIVFGLLAVLAGLVAFALLQTGDEQVDETYVAVAARSIPAHMALSAEMFEARLVPSDLVEEDAVTGATPEDAVAELNLGEVEAVHTRYPLPRGAQVRPSYLSIESQLPAGSQEVAEGDRLLTVSANVGAAVGGILRVGDKVDIYALSSVSPPGSSPIGDETVAVPALTDVEIVAISLNESLVSSLAGSQLQSPDAIGDAPKPEDMLPGNPLPEMYTVKLSEGHVGRALLLNSYADELVMVYRGEDAEATPWMPSTLTQALCTPPDSDVEFDTPYFCPDVDFDLLLGGDLEGGLTGGAVPGPPPPPSD